VVQEDGHLQLRQLRPGAQPRPAAVRHEAARRVALQQNSKRIRHLQRCCSENLDHFFILLLVVHR
jgi:hypothetical protein